nr:PREDICTED: taste receptor type 2 member 8-like [Anolis carolinensis]|eukprot:XP_016852376.1 PREDICTED: taste receptor type 2 member 8-like [Anolis carolinensis]
MIPCDFLLTSLRDVIFFWWMFFNTISNWCATWLSVFYCVKVANFANPLFLWLKARINMLAPILLELSIAVFMVSFLLSLVDYFVHTKWCNVTETLPENASQIGVCFMAPIIFLPMQFSFYVITLCLSTIATILLLISLWRHTKNLKKSGVDIKDLSTQVHIKVMAFLLFWFFFYFIDFIALILYADLINNMNNAGKVQGLLFAWRGDGDGAFM